MLSKQLALAAVAVLALAVTAKEAPAQALSVAASGAKKITLSDKVGKNQFTWTSEAPLESIRGTSEGVTGTFTMDPKNLATLRGTVTTQVATMKTGNETRDSHLKSDQWLDAAKYQTITYSVSSVKDVKVSGATATGIAVGQFTMHGVTKPIEIPFKLQYIDASAKTKDRAPGDLVMFTSEFSISLKDFNVNGTKGIVGSKVGETIKITAQLFGSTGL